MSAALAASCSRVGSNLSSYTVTFGAAPLIIAPVSEVYGRSTIYFVSAFIFTLFFIPQALARNIETMLVCRFISGIAGSSAVSLVGGTLADVWSGPEVSHQAAGRGRETWLLTHVYAAFSAHVPLCLCWSVLLVH